MALRSPDPHAYRLYLQGRQQLSRRAGADADIHCPGWCLDDPDLDHGREFAQQTVALIEQAGGEALFGFSVIMIFGIILGTYSSVYVAAPVILLWGVKRGEEEATPIKFGALCIS